MKTEQYVLLLRNGRSQQIRIPREIELKGNEAIIQEDGRLTLLAAWEPLNEDFPELNTSPPYRKNTSVTASSSGSSTPPDHAM